jgi:amidase
MLACAAAVLSVLVLAAGTASAATLDLETLDGPTAIQMMERGELTSVELTEAYLARIKAMNEQGPGLNAVTQLNKEVLKEAQYADEMRAEGKILSPAMGLPILVKDLIDVKGMYTSAGNWSLRNSYPETDSGVAKKLREGGVPILGKAGLGEFAFYFGSSPNGFGNLTGQVLDAVDADQNPGGSSSGSGSAGAAALSMLTIGTSTGGSITQPSSENGLVGLTPTDGLVPGYGIAPLAASQDIAGPMTRTVADAALTLSTIAGYDPLADVSSIWGPGVDPNLILPPQPDPLPNYMAGLDPNYVRGKRIGYTNETQQTLEAKQILEEAGATLVYRPTIPLKEPLPPSVFAYEAARDVTRYYERLGPNAPIHSLQEEVADNRAHPHEALKFGDKAHYASSLIDTSPNSAASIEYRENLVKGKELSREQLNLMLENGTPDDPSDDFIALLGAPPNPTRPGYPWLSLPMGYSSETRRVVNTQAVAPLYHEEDLIGIGYVIEQGLLAEGKSIRKPVDQVNPAMYRCVKTVPLPAFHERGSCNPDYESIMQMIGSVPDLPFTLETETVSGLEDRMEAGTLTATDLTKAYLARIAVANTAGPAIQAVRQLNTKALGEAEAIDAARAEGADLGPLAGIPVLLDDGIDAAGLPSTGGSIALQDAMPERSSRIVTKLKSAGAIILGKANVSELNGLFSSKMPEGYSSLGGQVLVPSDTDKNPGGSSAGSAAATASGMAAMSVGMETSTETAQLIAPASVAGLVGLKPTVGRVSRAGVMPVAKSQDSPGPIAKTVEDAATELQAIAGPDFRDPATESAPPVGDYVGALDEEALDGKTVAVVDPSGITAANRPVYEAAVTKFGELGADTETVTLPTAPPPNPVTTREFKRDLDGYLGGLNGGFAHSLDEIIAYDESNKIEGLKYLQGELIEADEVDLGDPTQKAAYEEDLAEGKAEAQEEIDHLLEDADVIAVPEGSVLVGIADRAGYPVLTVPGGFGATESSNGHNPVGVVFITGAFEEEELLADGYAFERATLARQDGPSYAPEVLPEETGVPSWTNPSMWRCVELSDFYSPQSCRPGMVEPLAMTTPEEGPTPPAEGTTGPGEGTTPPAGTAGTPKLALAVTPKKITIGAKRKLVAFTAKVTDVGDADVGTVSLCVAAPPKKAKVLGSQCIKFQLTAGASKARKVMLKVKPDAVGTATTVRFTAKAAGVKPAKATAGLKVKAG